MGRAQNAGSPPEPEGASRTAEAAPAASAETSSKWEGQTVQSIGFAGVELDRLAPLPGHLAQAAGAPLSREAVKKSLRQLFATGLFETIWVEGTPSQDGVALVFRGAPRMFIGNVSVEGAKGATLDTQLERSSQLAQGTRLTKEKLAAAMDQMRRMMEENGFHEAVIKPTLTEHPEEQLTDIAFTVNSGPQARVGAVEATGDLGMSVEQFRHAAHLKTGAHIDHDTASRALAGVLKTYRNEQRLEAEIKLEAESYDAKEHRASYRFYASRGPVVQVIVEGAKTSPNRLQHVIPIYEEGTVDEDLLNEGNRQLRDFYQRMGFFDVRVEHEQQTAAADKVTILYRVQLGPRRRVESVTMSGNHYFRSATLQDLLTVRAADSFERHGIYSQALVTADINALVSVYRNNGFMNAKVTANSAIDPAAEKNPNKTAPVRVAYHVEEGAQQRVGTVSIDGNGHVQASKLSLLLNTVPGQSLSPQKLAGDRDALLTEYLSRGFDNVRVEVSQAPERLDPALVDVSFHIDEGRQIFVRKVLLTGLVFTRPSTVAKAITLHAGDPLDPSALTETQRNLYDFALFNEIDTAIQNPDGEEVDKTVLLHAVEARRWALTYGVGFEAQTGTPQNDCRGALATGVPCSPNGKTGVSPRVLIALTRNNLGGREQSASIQGTYGLLEQKVNLLFQNPHFYGNRDFGFSISGGYANSQDITTYVASKFDLGVRWTQHFLGENAHLSKANTFIYEFDFRRVKVAESSLQVCPCMLTALSTAARVSGPGFTWLRDTRDSPLDAHRGTYSSIQEFLSSASLGSQAQFNRLDLTHSSYHNFGAGRFVLARTTRYGQERAFGAPSAELLPLPERLYAGGATSFRAFPINAAGPRDPETGYPIGGAGALINSTELRLPPPTLPFLGTTVSFVLFHDMGNVFTNARDAWASAIRIHQPERDACKTPIPVTVPPTVPSGPSTSTGPQGACKFNYFAHAPGLGLRYHTPVGPIRMDFSYTLNPPIYPVTYDYSLTDPGSNPHVGQAGHFNFFFSLGQAF